MTHQSIIEIPLILGQHNLDGCGGVGVSTRDCGSPARVQFLATAPLIQLMFVNRVSHSAGFSFQIRAIRVSNANNQWHIFINIYSILSQLLNFIWIIGSMLTFVIPSEVNISVAT